MVLKTFENDIVQKLFFAVAVLQFGDSCYVEVEAEQYHLASFSTRNSTLNTSLRLTIKNARFYSIMRFCLE